MSELNLDKAMRELIIKALNKYDKRKDVANALGVSVRTCGNLMRQYKIIKETKVIYKTKKNDVRFY